MIGTSLPTGGGTELPLTLADVIRAHGSPSVSAATTGRRPVSATSHASAFKPAPAYRGRRLLPFERDPNAPLDLPLHLLRTPMLTDGQRRRIVQRRHSGGRRQVAPSEFLSELPLRGGRRKSRAARSRQRTMTAAHPHVRAAGA